MADQIAKATSVAGKLKKKPGEKESTEANPSAGADAPASTDEKSEGSDSDSTMSKIGRIAALVAPTLLGAVAGGNAGGAGGAQSGIDRITREDEAKKKADEEKKKAEKEAAENEFKEKKLAIDERRADIMERGMMDKKNKTQRLPADKVLALTEGAQVHKLLQELEQTVDDNTKSFGPVKGRLASMNPWNESAKTIDAQVRNVRQTIGKLKEGGVLRKEDEEKYAKMLPELSDTPEVAKNKLILVAREMMGKQNDYLTSLSAAGYDVDGLMQQFEVPELPKVLAGKEKGDPKEAIADEVDPQIQQYATSNKLPYAQAQAIIESRRAKRGNRG